MQHSWFSNDCHPPSTAATKVLWVSLSDKWNTNSTNFPLIFNKISQKIKLHSPKSKNGCLEDGVPFARMNIGWSTMVPIACPIMVHMSMRAFWVFSWDSPKTNQDHWFISNPNSAICWSQKKSKHSLLCSSSQKKSYKFHRSPLFQLGRGHHGPYLFTKPSGRHEVMFRLQEEVHRMPAGRQGVDQGLEGICPRMNRDLNPLPGWLAEKVIPVSE